MSTRNFEDWFKTFRASINEYEYYTDFAKVYEQAEKLKVEIYILNSLINSPNIESDFEKLLAEYPKCLKVIPILLAVRTKKIFCQDDNGEVFYNFAKITQTVEQYKYFMRRTGLFDLLQNHVISNLYDYVTGVEVGLDSNSRKNRGGKQMERLVKGFLQMSNVEFYEQMEIDEIESKWRVDLSAISAGGISTKRFDFVVKTSTEIFLLETNFYAEGGSKLNETARSYKMLAQETQKIENVHFIWITDGEGWKKAKNNLQETFLELDTLYNIKDLENGIFVKLFT
ncbi:MAG: type II restriction endonuclease [Selenomonadaceae bacterium]|nr:type II restriction endonuclease [Selenomonadaceae bacterium]